MVGDNHVHLLLLGVPGLVHGGDAAVHRDNEADPPLFQGAHSLPVEAVAFLHPVGDVGNDRPSLAPKKIGEQTGGRNAVHVIVPVDGHRLPPLQSGAQPRRRKVHVLHQKRVVEQLPAGGQKGLGLLCRVQSPCAQGQGRQGGDSGLFQLRPGLRPEHGALPLLIFHRSAPPFTGAILSNRRASGPPNGGRAVMR